MSFELANAPRFANLEEGEWDPSTRMDKAQLHINFIDWKETMKLIRIVAVITSLVMLSGCASNFVRPASEKLALGKSTSADITSLVGKPTAQNDNVVMNGEKTKVLTYYYNDGAKFWGLIIPQRTLSYTLYNDTMVGEEFNSTMEGEATEFDGKKAVAIKKGTSTRADVIALLGKPSGEVLYPVIKDKNGRGLVYAYSYARFAGMLTTYNNYLLVVSFDDKNIVTDVSYKVDNVEQFKS